LLQTTEHENEAGAISCIISVVGKRTWQETLSVVTKSHQHKKKVYTL